MRDAPPWSWSCLKEHLLCFHTSSIACLYDKQEQHEMKRKRVRSERAHCCASTTWLRRHALLADAPDAAERVSFPSTLLLWYPHASCLSKLGFGVRCFVYRTFSMVFNKKCFKRFKAFFSPFIAVSLEGYKGTFIFYREFCAAQMDGWSPGFADFVSIGSFASQTSSGVSNEHVV